MLARLVAFGEQMGLGADAERLADAAVIEAFCARLPGRAPATKGTYRSLAPCPPQAPGRRFPGAGAPPPYSPAQRAELLALARAQRSPEKVASALTLVCAGLGAGLRPVELAVVSAADVALKGEDVAIDIGGAHPRTVAIAAPYGAVLAACATASAGGFLFRPGASRREAKNLVNDFCQGLTKDPAAPWLSLTRCRASFICDRLATQMPLADLCRLVGIAEVESLLRYARHVRGAPQSKAALRARMRAER